VQAFSSLKTGCNAWEGTLLGVTHWASGTWSSHKAGLPLPAVGLSYESSTYLPFELLLIITVYSYHDLSCAGYL
jgi:hypothetical protein